MSTDPIQQTPSAPPAGAGQPVSTQPANGSPDLPSNPEERQLAMLCHLGALLPGFGWIVPLIIWNMKKESAFIEDQAKESANFLINAAMIFVLCVILAQLPYIGIIGILLTLAVVLGTIALGVIAGMAANQGKIYRYPFNARYF